MSNTSDCAATGSEQRGVIVSTSPQSPGSTERLARRIHDLPNGRYVMTLTKNADGMLFWTIQEMGQVER